MSVILCDTFTCFSMHTGVYENIYGIQSYVLASDYVRYKTAERRVSKKQTQETGTLKEVQGCK